MRPANTPVMNETTVHIVSKLGWWLFAPANLVMLALLAGAALLWTRWRKAGRLTVTVVALAAVLIAVLPLSDWAMAPLENRFQTPRQMPERITGIITLGGVVNANLTMKRGQVALLSGAERLTEFVALARQHPEARLVFSGGTGSLLNPDLKEAPLARRLLVSLGFDVNRVAFEDQSRNTYENAVLTQALVKPKPGERWVLVTSALHMPRSVGVFRAAGWEVIPYPVDYLTRGDGSFALRFDFQSGLNVLRLAAREWTGLLVYRLLGRTKALFPAP